LDKGSLVVPTKRRWRFDNKGYVVEGLAEFIVLNYDQSECVIARAHHESLRESVSATLAQAAKLLSVFAPEQPQLALKK
jgi:hypothetical protein